MAQVFEQQDFARELALSLGAAEHQLLLVDEFAKDCIDKAGSDEMREAYANILAAAERARVHLYNVRNDVRAAMRMNRLDVVESYKNDH